MTLYVGEQFRITATANEYEGDVITDTNVTSVTVSIFTGDGDVLIDEAAMSWDSEEQVWEYLWDTDGLTAGSHRYRVTVVGADGKPSWEWGRARLARNPFQA